MQPRASMTSWLLRYWMGHLGFSLNRDLTVSEGPAEFFPSAYLYFNPKYCINMAQTRLKFFEKLVDGTYRRVDPPEVRFEVFELPENSNLTLCGADLRKRPAAHHNVNPPQTLSAQTPCIPLSQLSFCRRHLEGQR